MSDVVASNAWLSKLHDESIGGFAGSSAPFVVSLGSFFTAPPPYFFTTDTDIEMLGVFLFASYCSHVNDHILAGMQAFYSVSSA